MHRPGRSTSCRCRLHSDHKATLLGVNRDGIAYVQNPPDRVPAGSQGNDAVVVAQGLGSLSPLDNENALERDDAERNRRAARHTGGAGRAQPLAARAHRVVSAP